MKRFWFFLILAILAMAIGLVVSCGDDDDDDDDDDNDDNNDTADDDDDDDDDASGNVMVSGIDVGVCKSNISRTGEDFTETPLNVVEARWQDGVFHVWHMDAYVNCELQVDVSANLDDGILEVTEIDSGMMNCMCLADLEYDIQDLPEVSEIEFKIKGSSSAKAATEALADFIIVTNADEYEWRLPNLEFIQQKEENYSANSPIALRVNACSFEDDGNPLGQDPLKIQIYRSLMADYVGVYTIDRHNLTTPGTITTACSMLDYDMPGLPAGNYQLLGYGNDGSEYNVWYDAEGSLLTID